MPLAASFFQIDVATYPALFRRVKETLLDGQKRIEQEKIRTYWQAGKLIQTHILQNKSRAQYGAEVMTRLAKDLDVSYDLLYRCVRFVLAYPDFEILVARPKFSWTHYKKFITVADSQERANFENAAIKGGWNSLELGARIKHARSASEGAQGAAVASEAGTVPGPMPLGPLRGQLYTYQIQKRKVLTAGAGELVVDLGFSTVHNVEASLLGRFSAGDIVASFLKEDVYRFSRAERTLKDLYTYRALVERVVDADTLKVHVDLGFDTWSRQTLRLRGVDAPEVGTKSGDEAKAFVQSLLKESDEIVIRSSRSDKYDRYLADVYIPAGTGEVFLNNLLLEKGLAVRWGM